MPDAAGDWLPVAKSEDVQPHRPLVVDVQDIPIALVRTDDGALHAVQNVCPHRGGPVGEGGVKGNVVTCPWHAWTFDLSTGQHTRNPGVRLRLFDVREDGGDILVRLPA